MVCSNAGRNSPQKWDGCFCVFGIAEHRPTRASVGVARNKTEDMTYGRCGRVLADLFRHKRVNKCTHVAIPDGTLALLERSVVFRFPVLLEGGIESCDASCCLWRSRYHCWPEQPTRTAPVVLLHALHPALPATCAVARVVRRRVVVT